MFKLTEENIRQLDDAGFMWILATYTRRAFDERYAELMNFKEKAGHCDVPATKSGEYKSLGDWCNQLRVSYKKIQNQETLNMKLTEQMIQQLDDTGFRWSLVL